MRLKLSQSLGNFASEKPSPEGEAYLFFALFSWLPLGGKLSTKLTDEGQLQYRVNSFLQKTSCPPHHLASQGASPAGEAYLFFALFSWLPLGGKLSTKLTDEGQLQYRVNSFLQKTSCPPHHLASQGASPAGEAYLFFALFSWLPLGGKPIFLPYFLASPWGEAYICGGDNRGLFSISPHYFRKVFKNSLSSADTLYESRHFEIALFIVNLFKCGAPVRYANVFSRKCVKHSAISHAFAIFT